MSRSSPVVEAALGSRSHEHSASTDMPWRSWAARVSDSRLRKRRCTAMFPRYPRFEGDVRDAASVDAVVRDVNDGLGSIDVVVHAAGVSAAIGCTWEVDPLVWRDDLDTSVLGAFVLAQRVVPRMLDRSVGRLIALSSYAAVRPAPHQSGYAAGKAAVVSFVESLDAELSGTGVHAFSVTPGLRADGDDRGDGSDPVVRGARGASR